jgi:predicted  nucleic acid-binding Zn-ribbon protein
MSLLDHFGKQESFADDVIVHPADECEVSLALSDIMPKKSPPPKKKTYEELEEENNALHYKLRQTQGDIRATVSQSAIELPALKVRLMMLEEELNESVMLEEETMQLKQELEEAKADKESAQLAAQQLAEFMERQKEEHGFRGDEIQKKRLWYFHKTLDEKWVNFVVVMLTSFREQMRLLGDYFEMVVQVVESPDILTMLGPNQGRKKNWWGGGDKEISEEKELRHKLLTEHIKFFNARLIEIEDEITNRSESVDAINEALGDERQELESQLDETDFVRDLFSKKGEKLLKHMTELMTGPLFTLPVMPGVSY